MKTMYMHTMDGRPAYFDEDTQELYFVSNRPFPLAKDLKQIRKEQAKDIRNTHSPAVVHRDYVRVLV